MAFIYNGGAEPENHVKAEIAVPFQLDYATAAGVYQIPVPAGYLVKEVITVATQAFNGTSVSLKIGDGDDDGGYGDNTDLAIATAATATTPAVKNSRNLGQPYANGKFYAAADTVDLTFAPGTSATTGVLKGYVVLVNLKNGGVPAGATTVTPL